MAYHDSVVTFHTATTALLGNMCATNPVEYLGAVILQDDPSPTYTPPAGWVQVGSTISVATPDGESLTYFRFTGGAPGSPPPSYTWTASSGGDAQVLIFSDSGRSLVETFIQGTTNSASNASPVSAVFAGGTAAARDDVLVFMGIDKTSSNANQWSFGTPTGSPGTFTLRQNVDPVGFTGIGLGTIDNVSAGATGSIACTITLTSGTGQVGYLAFVVALTAVAGPTINAQPTTIYYYPGQVGSAAVVATAGSGGLTYQWYTATGTPIPGETNATYSRVFNYVDENQGYYCIVSDGVGSIQSSTILSLMLGGMDVWAYSGQPNPTDVLARWDPTFPGVVGGFETTWAPGRAVSGLPGHLPGEPLPAAAATLGPGTLNAEPSARALTIPQRSVPGEALPSLRQGGATSTETTPPFVRAHSAQRTLHTPAAPADVMPPLMYPATGFEHADPSARLQTGPPRHVAGEPLPPKLFTATGYEHADPTSRPQVGSPRHAPGEPLPAPEFFPDGFDTAWSPGRPSARPAPAPGGDAEPPRVYTATSYETTTAPRRPDLGPPRHVASEGFPVVATPPTGAETTGSQAIGRSAARAPAVAGDAPNSPPAAGGFDVTAATQRPAARAQPATADATAPGVFTATGFEHSEPTARPQLGPPRHVGGEPMPPRVSTATGYEHAGPGARPQPATPRYVAGEPIPAAEFRPSPVDSTWAPARAARAPQPPGGEATPPGVYPPTAFETAVGPRRADLGPPRHLPADALPRVAGSVAPGTLSDATPAAARAPARTQSTSGDVVAVQTPVAGFDPVPLTTRGAARAAPAAADWTTPSVQVPTGFEHAEPSARPQTGPPRHVQGEPVPPQTVGGAGIDTSPAIARVPTRMIVTDAGVILPVAFVGGFDSAAPAQRLLLRQAPAAGDPFPPRVFPPTGFEATAPGARPQAGPPRHLTGEPLRSPVLPQLVRGGDVAPAWARPQPPLGPVAGEPLPPRKFPPTGFEAAFPSARPQLGPPRHVPSDPPVTKAVRGAGIDNVQPVQRASARPADQVQTPHLGTLGPAVDSVTVRGRVFAPAQSFGGEAFTTPVWTAVPDAAVAQRRQDKPSHVSGEATAPGASVSGFDYQEPPRPRAAPPAHVTGEPVPGRGTARAALDASWVSPRTHRVPNFENDVLFKHAPPLAGAFTYVEPTFRRPTRQPLWIDSNGLPVPRIQPATLQIPREFEATRSIPVQLPSQLLVASPLVLQMPSKLLVDPPGAPALPMGFTVALSLVPTIPPAFEVALPRRLGIPSGFKAAENL